MSSTLEKLDICEAVILDIMDGNTNWYEIQANTGLSEERCKEIEKHYLIIRQEYEERHHII